MRSYGISDRTGPGSSRLWSRRRPCACPDPQLHGGRDLRHLAGRTPAVRQLPGRADREGQRPCRKPNPRQYAQPSGPGRQGTGAAQGYDPQSGRPGAAHPHGRHAADPLDPDPGRRIARSPWAFLVLLMFWLMIVFAMFGLSAPRNRVVYATIFCCGLSIASAMLLILGFDMGNNVLASLPSEPLLETPSPAWTHPERPGEQHHGGCPWLAGCGAGRPDPGRGTRASRRALPHRRSAGAAIAMLPRDRRPRRARSRFTGKPWASPAI